MNTVRGLMVWLAPPILASFACSAAWQLGSGAPLSDWRPIIGFSLLALIFTIGGSALLTLAFAGLWAIPLVGRYAVLIGLGAAVGAAMMVFGTSAAMVLGATFGTATAAFWVGFHRILYGSR